MSSCITYVNNNIRCEVNLDWLFIFVLPVALLSDPCSRQAAISFNVRTPISVDPANVITPFDVSRICIGGFPGTGTFPVCPFVVSDLFTELGSSKSRTSSFKIFTRQSYCQMLVIVGMEESKGYQTNSRNSISNKLTFQAMKVKHIS